MTDEKKQAAGAEAKQTKPTIHEIEIVIAPVNGWVWDAYCNGRSDYIDKVERVNKRIADYHGAVALIQAGFAEIKAPPELKPVFDGYLKEKDWRNLPADWIGLLEQEVAWPVERAFNRPSEWQVESRLRKL